MAPIESYADSRIILDVVAKQARTTDKRLEIFICSLREYNYMGEVSKLASISGLSNPSDTLTITTSKYNVPLFKLMEKNMIIG